MKRLIATLLTCLAASAAPASVITYHALLLPEQPVPPATTPVATGSGEAWLTLDTTTNVLHVSVDWSGLSSPTTVAHIHCCLANPGTTPIALPGTTVGVAVTPSTLPGFPGTPAGTGLTSGSYEVDIDLDLPSSFTTGFVTNFGGGTIPGAINAIMAGMSSGRAYFNIHTSANPGGEIRGFLFVPEPGALALAGIALGALAFTRRRRADAAG